MGIHVYNRQRGRERRKHDIGISDFCQAPIQMFCRNGGGHSEVCSCVSMKVLPWLLGINAVYWVIQQKRKKKLMCATVCFSWYSCAETRKVLRRWIFWTQKMRALVCIPRQFKVLLIWYFYKSLVSLMLFFFSTYTLSHSFFLHFSLMSPQCLWHHRQWSRSVQFCTQATGEIHMVFVFVTYFTKIVL